MDKHFRYKIRKLQQKQKLHLRQMAPLLEMETAQLSKIKQGLLYLKKEQIDKLLSIYKLNNIELKTLWLAAEIIEMIQ